MPKSFWIDSGFDNIGCNNSSHLAITIPDEDHTLSLDISLFAGELFSERQPNIAYVPANLTFFNVVNLTVKIDQQNVVGLDIVSIERSEPRPTPNRKLEYRDYSIELSPYGLIEFTSTGFRQTTERPV